MTSEDDLDQLLVQHFKNSTRGRAQDDDAVTRVLARLGSLPPQRRSWRHWPTALLAWDFAPAWPRVAALAGCTALGFAVGVIGPSLRGAEGWPLLSSRGELQLAAVLSEPEPMTGVLP
jgi:hypothetical protein